MEGADGEGSGCTAQEQYTSDMVWTRTRRAIQYGPGETRDGIMVQYGGFGTYKGSGAPCSQAFDRRSGMRRAPLRCKYTPVAGESVAGELSKRGLILWRI